MNIFKLDRKCQCDAFCPNPVISTSKIFTFSPVKFNCPSGDGFLFGVMAERWSPNDSGVIEDSQLIPVKFDGLWRVTCPGTAMAIMKTATWQEGDVVRGDVKDPDWVWARLTGSLSSICIHDEISFKFISCGLSEWTGSRDESGLTSWLSTTVQEDVPVGDVAAGRLRFRRTGFDRF